MNAPSRKTPGRALRGAVAATVALAAATTALAGSALAAEPPAGPAAAAGTEAVLAPPPAAGGLKLLPILMPAYRPETRWLLGAAVVLVRPAGADVGSRDSQLQVLAAATELGQYVVALRPSWYLRQDAVQLVGNLEVSRFPDELYGIGNAAPASSMERYTPVYLLADLGPLFRVVPGLYVGPSLRVQHASVRSVAPDGLLASGTVTGAAGGTTAQLGATAEWDTRDSTLYPRTGALLHAELRRADAALGSDFDFGLLRLDARRYVPLPGRHVLAFQAMLELRNGDPPFYDTGKLGGGEIMRGWYAGRYRDRQLWSAQAEYRLPLVWRLGAVAFGSAGGVAHDASGLADAVRVAGGGGLRVGFSDRVPINLRLDVAYGNATSVYFGLGEAF